jgi:methionyl-tRNA formyltransferase
VRAFDPFPGALTHLGQDNLKVWAAQALPVDAAGAAPGTVLACDAQGVRVATGQGVLCLTELQRAGGKRLPVAQFLSGAELRPGLRLGHSDGEAGVAHVS